ncbi:hypothetical protein BST63_14280 [Bradyrhizobium canariense]|uniref:Glycosyltransferase subfamily 4-like N-terminal domain-containing protein n=1 Tax=Bradyrhizobium canariense TaxID=255045 RepID=A0ABX3X3X3_9BRAD|nr:glycosyltransferase family 4 protein [Bradyrhizobium canariense]OSJ14859.1 hypothetical protein BSR47_17600 [Bradyrhizobium canariense]OSJ29587.1 hypothetical protein BST63_14280 [Bradyrhizobium canariense]
MRIALIAPEIPDYSIEFARLLAEACEVRLVIPAKFKRAQTSDTSKLTIEWVEWPRQRSLANVPFMMQLSRRIRAWEPHVVHCLDANCVWFNLLRWLLPSATFVTTLHDVWVHPGDVTTKRVPRFAVKHLLKRSAAVIVHGKKLRIAAAKEFSLELSRIFVLSHPPLPHYFELAAQQGYEKPRDGAFRVLFFGRILEYKGLRFLIEAAPIVADKIKSVKFIVAGSGKFASYRAMIEDSSIFEIHNRFISESETARLFAEADLLVLPYTEASQSGVVFIGLPFGVPAVATDVGELGETVESNRMGIVVQPRNVNELASAIIRIASDDVLLGLLRKDLLDHYQVSLLRAPLARKAMQVYEAIRKV